MHAAPRFVRVLLYSALALLVMVLTVAAVRAEVTPGADDATAIRTVLGRAGLLADPCTSEPPPALQGARVTRHLAASAPELSIALGAPGPDGRADQATVTLRRWLTGTLEIERGGARTRKAVHDSCARQVSLRRVRGESGAAWRITSVSALVRSTPHGRASLPLVDLDTHTVSGGYLSAGSDLGELAVEPQNCAVAAPGDSVRVFVGGIDPGAQVCVFAGGRCVPARAKDASHYEAMVRLDGSAGLQQIGVTVFAGGTLTDASAVADSRTWVLPILVGPRPGLTQDWFEL